MVNIKMGFRFLLLLITLLISLSLRLSAQDIEGSADYPLFERLPGFSIHDYSLEEAGIYTFITDQDGEITIQGKKFTILYVCNCEESPLKIIRNFSNAAKKKGARTLEYSDNRIYIYLRKDKMNIRAEVFAGVDNYYLTIVEYPEAQ